MLNPNNQEPHCDKDFGGSHYHCGRCNGVSSMMGHYRSVHWIEGKTVTVPAHFCCPDSCMLDHPEEFEAEIAEIKSRLISEDSPVIQERRETLAWIKENR